MTSVPELLAEASLGPPATEAALANTERELGRSLPPEYRSLLSRCNGVDGPVGEGWLILHPVETLSEVQSRYADVEHLSGWLIIGSNGGGEAFVLDEQGQVFVAPWIGDRADAVLQGDIYSFVSRVHAGRMFD